MPGASDEIVTQLENKISAFPPISSLIQEGYTPEGILKKLFSDEEVKVLEKLPVQFKCKCSRDRVERAIIGLGNEEIQKMITEDKGAEVNCHFCNETYDFTEEELERLKK